MSFATFWCNFSKLYILMPAYDLNATRVSFATLKGDHLSPGGKRKLKTLKVITRYFASPNQLGINSFHLLIMICHHLNNKVFVNTKKP